MKNIIFFILFFFVLLIPLFIHVKVACKTQVGGCPLEIYNEVKKSEGKNIFSANKNIKKTLSKDKLVNDFSTQFKLPNILEVNIIVKTPYYAIKDINTNEVILINKNGEILGNGSPEGLPLILQNGKDINMFALKIMEGVSQMYSISSGQITADGLVVDMPSNIKVIFPLDGDYQVILGALRLIYPKVSDGDLKGKYREIDLRFKNPVLR